MLNLISDFLPAEADTQFVNEQLFAIKLHKTLQSNLTFFKHFNHDVYRQIIHHQAKRYAVFCTKDERFNIVETASGRVLYKENPTVEAQAEVESFCQAAPAIELNDADSPSFLQTVKPSAVILMFGVGAGLQLEPLLQQAKPSILVVYEPELDLFISSLNIIDWAALFATAAVVNTQISLQLANNGTTIAADLRELDALLPELKNVYLYRHLTHPVSDEVFHYLKIHNGQRNKLLQHNRQFIGYNDDQLFITERAPGVLANIYYTNAPEDALFIQNMLALRQYYPALFNIFANYQPKSWRCVMADGKHNLYCEQRSVLFYDDLASDAAKMKQRFLEHPIDNELILNQGGIDKFTSYVHFQALEKLQPILTQLQPRAFNDIDDVDNLIILGVALGLHIQLLLQERQFKNLFIFEPNVDYFYASLFVTDWARLFKEAAESEQRFYFNIGGSGDEYFHDIMGQYYQTGAYGLAKSLIYPAFLTPGMKRSLAKLQSQLLIIVAMGENFDHARYGIAHTFNSFRNNHGLLTKNAAALDNTALQDMPIFIVGNGPSLDNNYQYIIENRQNIVVISCGTALRSLYKLGITPDFHAEIEQNRATYAWISQVGDEPWLKTIALLSINGIHPDTARLFKDVYLALKDGESSTNFFRSILEEKGILSVSLRYSYPTVSNLALDLFTELGFRQIYLFGVDLGYVDPQNHHSKFSAYYRESDGSGIQSLKDFSRNLMVKGNFQDVVQTKPEFDFSRSIMELRIANAPRGTQYFNCSDGAYINGAFPLWAENTLIKPQNFNVAEAITDFFNQRFHGLQLADLTNLITSKVLGSHFADVAKQLCTMCVAVSSKRAAKKLLAEQWDYLVDSYYDKDKLSFYLLCGSSIYMLTVLARLIPTTEDGKETAVEFISFNQALEIWHDYLQQAAKAFTADPFQHCGIDVSHYFKKK